VNSPTIEKIKKLLSLAQSDNPNERDLAMSKAAALAAEANIDLASIDLSGVGVVKDEPMVKDDLDRFAKRRRVEERFIYYILRDYFNVDVVWGWRGQWTFIGRKADVEFAKWLCAFLLEEFDRRWKAYRGNELREVLNTTGFDAQRYRNTYVYGLYQGLAEKLKTATDEAKSARVAAMPAEQAVGFADRYALVLQDETKRREQAKREFFPRLGTARSSSGVRVRSSSVINSGRASGRTISCSRPLN